MKLNQQPTHRKSWSPAVHSGSTGGLDPRKLVIKGDSRKGTPKKQQVTPMRGEVLGEQYQF